MQDRAPRLRVLKGAKIIFNKGGSVIDCTARNLAEGGAALDVETTAGLPSEFELVIQGTPQHRCQIRWRRPGRIGVAFLKSA
jgi:hypothetical protein